MRSRADSGVRRQIRELEERLATEPSARQLETLQLLADGLNEEEIGSVLFISASTVNSHLKAVRLMFGVRNRSAAVAVGLRRGLIA